MARMKKDKLDPSVLKRGLAGGLPNKIIEICQKDTIGNHDLRMILARFFVSEDIMDRYLRILIRADKYGIVAWTNTSFRSLFISDLIKQFSKSIWKTHDNFTILAVMDGEYRPRADKQRTYEEHIVSIEAQYGLED